nr:serine/threonine-protein kinase Kist-like isoform X1 [Procambarus clarkii]
MCPKVKSLLLLKLTHDTSMFIAYTYVRASEHQDLIFLCNVKWAVWTMSVVKELQFQELPTGEQLVTPFGIFRVRNGIAIGRCCEVYDGEDCVTGEAVALKVFRRYQQYRGALQRELFFLHTLNASGAPIVKHIGELEWEGRDVLVQELLSLTVRDILLCQEGGACSPWFVITLTTHILKGLKHLHDNGVVHADLKPPNILWDARTATFKLVDFGVSFTTSEQFLHAVQSKGYQAPECVKWNRRVSDPIGTTLQVKRPGPPADIWSAGCIIVESLTGIRLFSDSLKFEDVDGRLKSALSTVCKSYPLTFLKETYNFITRCLQIIPEERANAWDLLCDPWLMYHCRPSYSDLMILPTAVLRILNVTDASSSDCADVEKSLLNLCKKYGDVTGYHLELVTGNFYVRYETASLAEIALQQMTEMVFSDRTLIVTFYPLISWENEEFY